MRSRYSAYVLDLTSYLLATWHPTTRPAELILEDFKWLGLRILRVETNAKSSVVEFIARYRQQGRAYRLHEVSRFVCLEGRWFYIDGQMQS
jgi:SEC-C motif-containing protein